MPVLKFGYCRCCIAPGVQCALQINYKKHHYCSLHRLIEDDIEDGGMTATELHAAAIKAAKGSTNRHVHNAIKKNQEKLMHMRGDEEHMRGDEEPRRGEKRAYEESGDETESVDEQSDDEYYHHVNKCNKPNEKRYTLAEIIDQLKEIKGLNKELVQTHEELKKLGAENEKLSAENKLLRQVVALREK